MSQKRYWQVPRLLGLTIRPVWCQAVSTKALFLSLRAHSQHVNYSGAYWAVQVGLLPPLTFAWHRLSPLAAFTSGGYFLHNGRQ